MRLLMSLLLPLALPTFIGGLSSVQTVGKLFQNKYPCLSTGLQVAAKMIQLITAGLFASLLCSNPAGAVIICVSICLISIIPLLKSLTENDPHAHPKLYPYSHNLDLVLGIIAKLINAVVAVFPAYLAFGSIGLAVTGVVLLGLAASSYLVPSPTCAKGS
jgi:hypothetical protein